MSVLMVELKHLTISDRLTAFSRRHSPGFATVKNSIEKDGLLNPLIVIKQKGRFIVVDGKKRLLALRELAKSSKFRRALYKIPCIVDCTAEVGAEPTRPALMTGPELVHKIIQSVGRGMSRAMLAQRYECSASVIEDALSLRNLNPRLLKAFNNGSLTLEQSAAFATIDNPNAQWTLLLQLGPSVSNADIISAIKSGEAVLDLPCGEVIILPSRNSRKPKLNLDNAKRRRRLKIVAA
ncbi:ParB/RepB/Spo0J family partition protein [Hellea balneolensis]|uniref:ParB/RepB/Spo0J family partition protein n=1 Tax=Hellea balneolensis TaxID=287478 RepID=UPI00040D9B9D|nr:ParB/RepB/Spo0J family partition protein [Hellea balneolensis]